MVPACRSQTSYLAVCKQVAKWNQAKPDSLIDPADYATLDESANSGSETTRSKRQYSTPNQCSAKATRGAVGVAVEDVQPLAKKNKTAAVKAEVDEEPADEQVIWACCTASNPSLLHCTSAGSLLFLLLFCLAAVTSDGVVLVR